jgi:hypothetical protein
MTRMPGRQPMPHRAPAAIPPVDGAPHPASGRIGARAELRRLPYPYRALLAICSDLDETPDRNVYLETMRFLNTTETTRMGPGLGLEIGNSIYFDMPRQQFAYWTTDDAGRAMVRDLIRSGHIDCLHSFGDLATTRGHAARALDELARHDCRLQVWIDHAVAPSNFGADIMRGIGDVPDSPAYHADLSHQYGIQFVWRGRVTSVIGQDVGRRLRGLFTRRHPGASAVTVAKELVKGALARLGSAKYAMHGPNRVLRPTRLRSGHDVWEFLRSNPSWAGVDRNETAEGLANVLSERLLDHLVAREGVCLLYTHLGKIRRYHEPFEPRTRAALRRLGRYAHEGRILVTTTRRLLGYCRASSGVRLATTVHDGELWIDVTADAGNVADLAGLSIYVPDPERARLTVNGHLVHPITLNLPDHTGRPSISVPRRPLEFPSI